MKSITKEIYEGFFSDVGGSLSYFKKLLIPIFELNNPNRKNTPDRNDIDDILTKLPEKFGFNIYKYNRDQTEVIWTVKIMKKGDDLFLAGYGDKDAREIKYRRSAHYNIEDVSRCVRSFYFSDLPLRVVMTYDGEEVK